MNHDFSRIVLLGHSGFIGARLGAALDAAFAGVPLVTLSIHDLDLTAAGAAERLAESLDPAAGLVVLSGIKKQFGDTLEIFERNMAIAATVCRAIERQNVRRVLFYSSAEVYGETTDDTAITERTPVRPTSYYGAAKFASETLLRKTASASGASLALLRPPLVYGPGDSSSGYGPSGFTRAAVRGERITLWGEGTERRDFLFVDDLARVTCRLLDSHASGVVNVASGASATFRHVIDALASLTGAPLDVVVKPRTRPSVDQGYRIDRLRQLVPDFTPMPLADGLRQLVDHERAVQPTA